MAGTDGADTNTEPAPSGRRWIWLGAAALLLCALLAGLWLSSRQQPPAPKAPLTEVGVVDLKAAMQAHNAYASLAKLREDRQAMAADLAMESRLLLSLMAPNADHKPFEDAVQQKNSQAMLARQGEQMAKLRAAEQAKRKETEPEYAAARDEINGAYLNAIFNIRLKLDNAKVMHLTPEAVADLENRLDALQRERGDRQQDLAERYEASIRAYTAALAVQNGIELQASSDQTVEQLRAEEMKKQSDAQLRNSMAIQKNMLDSMERRQRVAAKRAALAAKDQEIAAMEDHMLKEIAGKAAKLAVIHHLLLILANPSVNLAAIPTGMLHIGAWPEKYEPLVNIDAMDLTDELIQELK